MQAKEDKKQTPEFVTLYFEAKEGKDFLIENPPKDLSPEVMLRMTQRIKR
jgi:hypothetical protein